MKQQALESDRFNCENVLRISVQVPEQNAQTIIDFVLKETSLEYGDYDRVTFRSTPGI